MHRNYGIIRLAGKPVIALPPGSRRTRLAGASRIQGYTRKRALFKHALRGATATGLDRFFAESTPSPLATSANFDLEAWLRQINRDLEIEASAATVIWPWPPGSGRGRLYVHILDHSERPVAFSKISLTEECEECLRAEARMLRMFEGTDLRCTKVPAVLSNGSFQGRYHLTVEPVPVTAQSVKVTMRDYPGRVVSEIAGTATIVRVDELSGSPWWERFLRRAEDAPGFMNDIATNLGDYGVALCRVHGDFEPKNLVQDGRLLWVLDWERGDLSGPRLADPLGYYVSVHARDCRRRPATVLSEILRREGAEGATQRRLEVGMALAFLHGYGSVEATRLLRCWRPLLKG